MTSTNDSGVGLLSEADSRILNGGSYDPQAHASDDGRLRTSASGLLERSHM